MMPWKRLGASALITGLLMAQPALVEDPVMKALALRQSDGSADPPPVTRGVQEPPPLPPPESNIKDTPGYRASKRAKRTTSRAARVPAARTSASRTSASRTSVSRTSVSRTSASRNSSARRAPKARPGAVKPVPAPKVKKKLPVKK